MAWLRLTLQDGRTCLANTEQVLEIFPQTEGCSTKVRHNDGVTSVRESVDEIAAMIADTERAERLDGIFKAIVYNFPHGYDPAEIVETARRLLDALDKPRGV